jgi:ATP-dependent helicase/DNAse subunit B
LPGDFVPIHFEARFLGSASLSVQMDGDRIKIHGVVDRVDRDPAGNIRVIDYKTAGPYRYSKQTLDRGEILQLPLYALAAQDALDLGQPVDGFYWHIRQAEPSSLQLADYGPEEAIGTALSFVWEAVRGARQGYFRPQPPANGCPNYCPAVAFCWRYKPGSFR